MPRRSSVRRIATDPVQGDGSWVEITSLRVKEIREIARSRDGSDEPFDAFEAGINILKDHLVRWNWADEDGNSLPQPADDQDVFEDLTNEEVEFLIELFGQQSETAKNSKGRLPSRSG